MRWVQSFGVGLLLAVCCAPATHAAVILASDNAADPAYAGGWGPGTNGGSGWGGAWSFLNQGNTALTATSNNRGWFMGDSRANDSGGVAGDSNADGDINSPSTGKAWGVYSNTTDQVYAIRPLSAALQVGQTISFDFDNGNVATSQVVGVRLLSNTADIASRVFECRFVGGDSFYTVIASPNQTSTMGFSREGIHVEYTLTGANTFSLKATRLQDGTTFTTTGTNSASGSIMGIALKNQLAGSGAAADAYFNNLTVSDVPEPASLCLIGLGALGAMRKRR